MTTPKTAAHDFTDSRARLRPSQNGLLGMDIQPLADPLDWFRQDRHYARLLKLKHGMSARNPALVTGLLPEGQAGARELIHVLAEFLPRSFPGKFNLEGTVFHHHLTGKSYDLSALPENPLVWAGQWVQEDLVLLHPTPEGTFQVVGGSVHFPALWSLPEKIGRTIAQVHAPVPALNAQMESSIDRFLARLRPGKPFWRINALVTTSWSRRHYGAIHDKSPFKDGIETTPANVERWKLRHERQVFMRLPESDAIVFSIYTTVTPFPQVSAEAANHLAAMIRTFPERFVRDYRRWSDAEKETILAYLDAKSG